MCKPAFWGLKRRHVVISVLDTGSHTNGGSSTKLVRILRLHYISRYRPESQHRLPPHHMAASASKHWGRCDRRNPRSSPRLQHQLCFQTPVVQGIIQFRRAHGSDSAIGHRRNFNLADSFDASLPAHHERSRYMLGNIQCRRVYFLKARASGFLRRRSRPSTGVREV